MKNKHGAVATVVVVGGVILVVWGIRQAQRKPVPKAYPGGAYKLRNMGPERFMRRVPGIGSENTPSDVRKINEGAYSPVYPLTRAFSAPGF